MELCFIEERTKYRHIELILLFKALIERHKQKKLLLKADVIIYVENV